MIKKFFLVRYALCLSKLGCGNQSLIFDEDVAQNKFSKKRKEIFTKNDYSLYINYLFCAIDPLFFKIKYFFSRLSLFLFVFVCIEWKEEKGQMEEKVFFKMISGSHGIIF
jgi:hypothetical protein